MVTDFLLSFNLHIHEDLEVRVQGKKSFLVFHFNYKINISLSLLLDGHVHHLRSCFILDFLLNVTEVDSVSTTVYLMFDIFILEELNLPEV